MPQDVTKTRPAERVGLEDFLRQYRRLLAAFAALGAAPFLIFLVARIGPPWPEEVATSALVCVVNTVLLVLIYVRTAHARPAMYQRGAKWLAIIFAVSLVVFVCLKSFLCYNAPDWQHQVAGGFILQPDIIGLIKTEPHWTIAELLAGAKYDAHRIWIPWTVDFVRAVVLVNWLVLFAALSGVVALGLRWNERNKAGVRAASR
jgi:hypothetical protein